MNLHKIAITFATVLFAVFVLATGLYARSGRAFIGDLYETHQIAISQDRSGPRKVQEFEDLLRVNPDSLRGRGLLVNALLEANETSRALVVARAGVERATEDRALAALLILGRAQLASGRLEEAAKSQDTITARFPGSGEAAYQKAHLHVLRGEFEEAWNAYAQLRDYGAQNSTKEFETRYPKILALLGEDNTAEGESARGLVTRARHLEATGDIDKALDAFDSAYQQGARTPDTFFWLGVNAERSGDNDLALSRYLKAHTAPRQHAYAKIAHTRLEEESS